MRYEFAADLQVKAEKMSAKLFPHVKLGRIRCLRSYGSSSRGTIARCHALGKLLQQAMGTSAFYALEFISERFDKLSEDEQDKVIIHELMHIPKSFGGGFKHHDWVTDKNVNKHYRLYKNLEHEEPKSLPRSFRVDDETRNGGRTVSSQDPLDKYF